MKKISHKILAILLLSNSLSCVPQNNEREYEFNMSNEVKVKISVMINKAVENHGRIKKGDIINNLSTHDGGFYNSYSQMYYDKFNNIIYESYCSENETIPHRTVKTYWYDSKNNKKNAIYEKRTWGSEDYSYSKKLHERDKNGKLINIVSLRKSEINEEYKSEILTSYKYDSKGNRIEMLEYGDKWDKDKLENIRIVKSKTFYSNFNNAGNPQEKQKIENDLRVETVFDYSPNGKLVESEYYQQYSYGQLSQEFTNKYTYDNKANLLTIVRKGKGLGMIGTPNHLHGEEREQYIKEHYFGKNLKLEPTDIYIENTYDKHNNRVYSCLYNYNRIETEFDFLLNIPPPCGKVASYKYNSHGDWIERIEYYNDKPSFIITREIEYY